MAARDDADEVTRAQERQRKAHRQAEHRAAQGEPAAHAVAQHAQAAGGKADHRRHDAAGPDVTHAGRSGRGIGLPPRHVGGD
ncbi:hypothetical protein G6F57_023405 [Rhizopus arrhizus]|nr:hypothetical protein G6F57_023405 [Rhizopus arrhizus]